MSTYRKILRTIVFVSIFACIVVSAVDSNWQAFLGFLLALFWFLAHEKRMGGY